MGKSRARSHGQLGWQVPSWQGELTNAQLTEQRLCCQGARADRGMSAPGVHPLLIPVRDATVTTAGASVVLAMVVEAVLTACSSVVARVVDVELGHHLGRRHPASVPTHDVATSCLHDVAAHRKRLAIFRAVCSAIVAVRNGAHTGMPAASVRIGGSHHGTVVADCLRALYPLTLGHRGERQRGNGESC